MLGSSKPCSPKSVTLTEIFLCLSILLTLQSQNALDQTYDSALMQRIFHYCMIAQLWAINGIVMESRRPKNDVTENNNALNENENEPVNVVVQ